MDGEYKTLNTREQAMEYDEYEIKKLKLQNKELMAERDEGARKVSRL